MEDYSNKKIKTWLKFMDYGARMGCHQRADRSFVYKEYQFPLCARCTGVAIGYILMPVIFLVSSKYRLILSLSFCLIMFLDWLIQFLKIKESNNIRRLITGILAGIGMFYITCYIVINIIRIIQKI